MNMVVLMALLWKIESLIGLEITDENDTVVDMQKYARERWKNDKKNKIYYIN